MEEPETYRVIQIPHVRLPATKPSEQRLLKLRDFLNGLISKLEVGDSAPKAEGPGFDSGVRTDFAPNTEVLAILKTACGLCQGYCCQRGGLHHTFLSIETIRRYMSRHPGLRPADVRDIYLAYVGESSMEGSCLFHGPSGCKLPREMRADICNRFYCRGLVEFQNSLTTNDPVRVFLAAAPEIRSWARWSPTRTDPGSSRCRRMIARLSRSEGTFGEPGGGVAQRSSLTEPFTPGIVII